MPFGLKVFWRGSHHRERLESRLYHVVYGEGLVELGHGCGGLALGIAERRERRYGSFRRSFDVTGIDENAITAAYQNGVLELSLPKAQQVIPEARKILIE